MLIITLDGGLVQDVLTDNPALLKEKAIVVDYDVEDCDDCVTNMNGDDCCPARHKIRRADADYVADIIKITKKREQL